MLYSKLYHKHKIYIAINQNIFCFLKKGHAKGNTAHIAAAAGHVPKGYKTPLRTRPQQLDTRQLAYA